MVAKFWGPKRKQTPTPSSAERMDGNSLACKELKGIKLTIRNGATCTTLYNLQKVICVSKSELHILPRIARE